MPDYRINSKASKTKPTMVEHGQNNKIRVCYRKRIRANIVLLIHLAQQSPQRTILKFVYTILPM